jgi:hypothetical protein
MAFGISIGTTAQQTIRDKVTEGRTQDFPAETKALFRKCTAVFPWELGNTYSKDRNI